MATKTLEEVIQIVEAQQKKIQRLDDILEIQNLMGRYVTMGNIPGFVDRFYALKTPDVKAEVANYGVWDGIESVRRMLSPGPEVGDRPRRGGVMNTHPLTTPVIEVAGDGKTAKGVWLSPGQETGPDRETGKITAHWCWTKYGCDFVKEDGKWKVWHYHVYRMFKSPIHISWVDEHELQQDARLVESGWENPKKPDKPPNYDNPYSSTYVDEIAPAPPEPYETFDETFSYIP